MRKTRRFAVRATFALLVVGFLALVAIVAMTFWLGQRAQVYFEDVIAARDTRSAAVELRNAVQGAESSQRGFLLTGSEIYLSPYDVAKTQAQRQLDTLKRTLVAFPNSAVVLQRLTTVIGEKFGEMDETIALKRARQDVAAQEIIRSKRGKALMDEANIFFSGVVRSADDRLTTGVQEQRANAAWLRTFTIVGGFIIVLVVGAAGVTILRYTRDLRQARDEVHVLNSGLEERVTARTADLAQANEEIQRFAYIVTHDLRAPLVNIMGFTAELEGGMKSLQALVERSAAGDEPVEREARTAANEDLPEAIGFIRSSTKKMDGLINAILKLMREGRRTLRPERLVLAEVVEASAAAIRHQIGEANGEVHLALDVPPIVGDRLSLEQVFGNLLDNAVKYRAPDRPLRIDVRAALASDDRVAIEIADNGRGIAPQDRERVFELFRRSGVQDQPGEGIGLAYVRAVVRNLGGDITMTSEIGRGTAFRIVLPRRPQAEGMAA